MQQAGLAAVEHAAAGRPLRPSVIDVITPCSVWMSCWVGAMRVKMLRRLIVMVSRFSGGRKNSTGSSSRSSSAKNANNCCLPAAPERFGTGTAGRARPSHLNHS